MRRAKPSQLSRLCFSSNAILPLGNHFSVAEADRQLRESFLISSEALMEQAALLAWQRLRDYIDQLPTPLDEVRPLVVVAGKGNNGGDGAALARYAMTDGIPVVLAMEITNKARTLTHLQEERFSAMGGKVIYFSAQGDMGALVNGLGQGGLLVDGYRGIGLKKDLEKPHTMVIDAINECAYRSVPIIALDVPSGYHDAMEETSPRVHADVVYSFLAVKESLLRFFSGEIVTLPLSATAQFYHDHFLGRLWDAHSRVGYRLNDRSHKFLRGRLAVVAGSDIYGGAALLCLRAAKKGLAGFVNAMVPSVIRQSVLETSPSVVVSVAQGPGAMAQWLDQFRVDAAVFGPGVVPEDHSLDSLQALLAHSPRGVIDGGGLALVALKKSVEPQWQLGEQWILTPHEGELRQLVEAMTPDEREGLDLNSEYHPRPLDLLQRLAKSYGAVLVAKGPDTVVVHPSGRYHWLQGADGHFATAGTGDILAGLMGSILAGLGDAVTVTPGVTLSSQEAAAIAAVKLLWQSGRSAFSSGPIDSWSLIDHIQWAVDSKT